MSNQVYRDEDHVVIAVEDTGYEYDIPIPRDIHGLAEAIGMIAAKAWATKEDIREVAQIAANCAKERGG